MPRIDYDMIYCYEGSLKDGRPHGKGKLFPKGSDRLVYEGDFVEGRREGQGKSFNAYGELVYEGSFRNDPWVGKEIHKIRQELGHGQRVLYYLCHR